MVGGHYGRVQDCTTRSNLWKTICEPIVDVFVSQDDVLEAIKLQDVAILHESQRTRSNVESDEKEFVTVAHELATQRGICSMKIDALREKK